jgi:hypothetical protein
VDKQKRDKKKYTSKYNQEEPSPRRFNFREALGDGHHKIIHAMLPIDPSSTASLRTPLEAFIPGQT